MGGVILITLLMSTYQRVLAAFLVKVEGFRSSPYWDQKQWSWGYGTKVPGSISNPAIRPAGSITKEKALQDAIAHAEVDKKYLSRLLTRALNNNQLAALLSFSYNLGSGAADNLLANINSHNDAALFNQMRQYIYAGGQPSQTLADRREMEIDLWSA